MPLALLDLRPLFVDSGGERLAGLGHPAFLAGVCLPAIYACLIELYRDGRRGGRRAAGGELPDPGADRRARAPRLRRRRHRPDAGPPLGRLPAPRRLLLLLLGACLVPVLVLLAANCRCGCSTCWSTEADNLSGRELLWPPFEEAAAQSPWFGWGIGAGNAIIPPDSGRLPA